MNSDKYIDKERIEKAVREILFAIGENPDREGLIETPKRVANMYEEIFAGLHMDPRDDIKVFHEDYAHEMVVVKDIPLYSMCEHHLLPFYGTASVVYMPNENVGILGLSKIARIIDTLSKKPQLQERLSVEIADVIFEGVSAHGVAVMIEAEHMCMTMRGIKKTGSKTVTFAYKGDLKTSPELKREALSLLSQGSRR